MKEREVEMTAKAVHGTKEWAGSNINIQQGCEHDCQYCYAKSMAIRYKRSTADAWKEPVLREHALNVRYRKRQGRIMFPSTHDITRENIDACVETLKRLLEPGNELLIVTKPEMSCMQRLCRDLAVYRDQITFRLTIGSARNAVLKFWEPGAPTFGQRLASLKHAHAKGFATSVSCEPMLDGDIASVVEAVRPYVTDSIWLGKPNQLRQALSKNTPGNLETMRRADELIALLSDDAILALYEQYRDDPLIRWKDSIKKVVGIARPTEKGLDV